MPSILPTADVAGPSDSETGRGGDPAAPTSNRSVVAVIADPPSLFELGIVTELFGLPRPELDVPWYELQVVAASSEPIRGLGGLVIDAAHDLDRVADAGTIVFPGWPRDRAPSAELVEAVRTAHVAGARLLSICSGAFALAATGLLDGRRATTHWRYADELAHRHPEVRVEPNVLFVDTGSVLTSAGSAAGIDLGIHLIRRDHGAAVADAVARRLVVSPHRDGGQAQFVPPSIRTADPADLEPTLSWARARLDSPLTVADLAAHAAMSPRTFARRFGERMGTSPLRWLTDERLHRARTLFETTGASVDDVAHRCGLGSADNLRRHFHRRFATTPAAYRRRFRADASTPTDAATPTEPPPVDDPLADRLLGDASPEPAI